MSDSLRERGLSITLKYKAGHDAPWAVFTGSVIMLDDDGTMLLDDQAIPESEMGIPSPRRSYFPSRCVQPRSVISTLQAGRSSSRALASPVAIEPDSATGPSNH